MEIAQVQLGNVVYSLTEGQPLPIMAGDTLKVFYSFTYRMPQRTDVRIWASLYRYTAGILDRSSAAQTKQTITLEKALEWIPYEGVIDIVVGQVSSGIYGLICELPDYDTESHIDDSIEVTAPPNIWEMIGPLLIIGLMVGVMSMVTPKEGEEGIF